MATLQVGSLFFTSSTENGKEVYRTTLPSGLSVPLSDETISKSNDPAYLSTKKASILAKATDPRDQDALNSFYDSAPTALFPMCGAVPARARSARLSARWRGLWPMGTKRW